MVDLNKKTLIYEKEAKPNRYSAMAIVILIFILILNWLLAEFNIYRIDPMSVRIGTAICCILGIFPLYCGFNKKMAENENTKYIITIYILIFTFTVGLFYFFHATLMFVFTLSIACLYKSKEIGVLSLIGTCLIILITPMISYVTGLWDLAFIEFLYQIGFKVGIVNGLETTVSVSNNLGQIFIYIVLPKEFMTIVYGTISLLIIRKNNESIENQMKVQFYSSTDTLTGLYTRNYLDRIIKENALNGNIGLVLCDVDGLKYVNDNFGHEDGDILLKRCAESITRVSDEHTIGIRLGGDEFLILVEASDEQIFNEKVKTWRNTLNRINDENSVRYKNIKCSMSFGTKYGTIDEFNNLLKEADSLMYHYKNLTKMAGYKENKDNG